MSVLRERRVGALRERRVSALREPRVAADVCAVILAGGVASRFGAVTQVLPKCFLPVSSEETLLTRLLGHLREAGFLKAVISTSPQWFPVFDALLGGYQGRGGVKVLSNPAHAAGPLAALGNAAREIEEPRLLLCLPDIFFWENPFPDLAFPDQAFPDQAGGSGSAVLSGCPVDRLRSTPVSGFLTIGQGVVASLTYRQAARVDAFWPGIALFGQSEMAPLLESVAEGPIENLFAAAMARGVRFEFRPCGPFQNVNTMDEWLELLRG